jgi:hypothetical protein
MNRYVKGVAALSLCLALVGCENKSTKKTQTTTSGPGGKTTETNEKTVEQTGKNPPPVVPAQPVTPNEGK